MGLNDKYSTPAWILVAVIALWVLYGVVTYLLGVGSWNWVDIREWWR